MTVPDNNNVVPTFKNLTVGQKTAIGGMQYLHAALVENNAHAFYQWVNSLGDIHDETLLVTCKNTCVRVTIKIEDVIED